MWWFVSLRPPCVRCPLPDGSDPIWKNEWINDWGWGQCFTIWCAGNVSNLKCRLLTLMPSVLTSSSARRREIQPECWSTDNQSEQRCYIFFVHLRSAPESTLMSQLGWLVLKQDHRSKENIHLNAVESIFGDLFCRHLQPKISFNK